MSAKRLILGLGGASLCTVIVGVALFLPAGRWDLPWFCAYVLLYAMLFSVGFMFLDPGLIKERLRPGRDAQDTAAVAIGRVVGLAHCVIAGLDVGRYHWSDNIPTALQSSAFVLFAVAAGATMWTMIINPFFSTVVRIQEERGHHVISNGPYRIVRHPGYTFITVIMLTSGVALGSWWSTVAMWPLLALLVRRTLVEDRFLRKHLAGYSEYAQRVRYRLVPGIW